MATTVLRIYPTSSHQSTNARFVLDEQENQITATFQLRQVLTVTAGKFLPAGLEFEVPFRALSGNVYDYVITDADIYGVFQSIPDCLPGRSLLFPSKPVAEWFDVDLGLGGITFPATASTESGTVKFATPNAANFTFIETPQNIGDADSVVKLRVVDSPLGEFSYARQLTMGTGEIVSESGNINKHIDSTCTYKTTGTSSQTTPREICASYNTQNGVWSLVFQKYGASPQTPYITTCQCRCG